MTQFPNRGGISNELSQPAIMEDEVQVAVRGEDGAFLLIESTSKKLHLPSLKLKDGEDFKSAAERCLNEVAQITFQWSAS